MRRAIVTAAISAALVIASAAPAFGHSCANASRPEAKNAAAGGQGRWFYLDGVGVWVFDMPNHGSLLEQSKHCTTGVPRADKVYWNWTATSSPRGVVTGCGEAP